MRAFAILTRESALIRAISAFKVNSGQAVAMLCEDRTLYAHAIALPSTCDRSVTWLPTGGPYHRQMGYFGTHRESNGQSSDIGYSLSVGP